MTELKRPQYWPGRIGSEFMAYTDPCSVFSLEECSCPTRTLIIIQAFPKNERTEFFIPFNLYP